MDKVTTTHNGHVKENHDRVSVHFDSIIDLLDYKNTRNVNQPFFDTFFTKGAQTTPSGELDWLGETNYHGGHKAVIDHALKGDEKMAKKLKIKYDHFRKELDVNRANYRAPISKRKRRKTRGDFGDSVDIHMVNQGRCGEAWTRMKKVDVDAIDPLITIVIDIVGNASEKCESSFWRASVALYVCEELLKAGKSVKIIVAEVGANAMVNNSKLLTTSIVIKDYNQPVSIERVAAMVHFGFFRTFNFGAMAVQDSKLRSSLGGAVNLSAVNMPLHLKEELDSGRTKFLHIPRVRSISNAKESLDQIYIDLGIYKN
jgi:hypothetical protein